jgi:arylsulfatase
VLDAARPDHFGCHGYPRETTPVIDRLADESIVFERHYCQATFTGVSTPCLFTGQHPETHLVSRQRPLPESAFTLARGLEEAGYRTGLFSSIAMVWPEGPYGLGSDFQDVHALTEIDSVLQRGEERCYSPEPILRLFESWLTEHRNERLLAYVHFTPPHPPYYMPAEYARRFTGLHPPVYWPADYHPGVYDFPVERENLEVPALPRWINLYDANLCYADWAVGEMERLLREAGIFDETIFIVTSDHGEAFGEHGFVLHGAPWHEEVTRIPLLVRLPGGLAGGERITSLTASIDVAPTIIDLCGFAWPEQTVQGESLVPLIAGLSDRVHQYVFTRASEDGGKYIIRGERYALVLWGNGEWRALYDMELDPQQRRNIFADGPDVAAEMMEAFRTFAESQTHPPLSYLRFTGTRETSVDAKEDDDSQYSAVSPEVRRDLEALGYLK